MQKLRILTAAIILGATLLGPSASTSAHGSTYCGHGTSGYATRTMYAYAYNNPRHMHVYDHYVWHLDMGMAYDHNQTRDCTGGNGGGSW